MEPLSPAPAQPAPDLLPIMSNTQPKPIIFISYAHADEPEKPAEGEIKWLSFVTGYLRPAEKRGEVELWTDRLMRGGDDWEPDIERKLRACDIFILLVSHNSTGSDYIGDKGIAIIRERQAKGEDVHFYPLLLTPTPKVGLDMVRDRNMRPRDAKPLSSYSMSDRSQHMVDAADEIVAIAREIAARKNQPAPPLPTPSPKAEKAPSKAEAEASRRAEWQNQHPQKDEPTQLFSFARLRNRSAKWILVATLGSVAMVGAAAFLIAGNGLQQSWPEGVGQENLAEVIFTPHFIRIDERTRPQPDSPLYTQEFRAAVSRACLALGCAPLVSAILTNVGNVPIAHGEDYATSGVVQKQAGEEWWIAFPPPPGYVTCSAAPDRNTILKTIGGVTSGTVFRGPRGDWVGSYNEVPKDRPEWHLVSVDFVVKYVRIGTESGHQCLADGTQVWRASCLDAS